MAYLLAELSWCNQSAKCVGRSRLPVSETLRMKARRERLKYCPAMRSAGIFLFHSRSMLSIQRATHPHGLFTNAFEAWNSCVWCIINTAPLGSHHHLDAGKRARIVTLLRGGSLQSLLNSLSWQDISLQNLDESGYLWYCFSSLRTSARVAPSPLHRWRECAPSIPSSTPVSISWWDVRFLAGRARCTSFKATISRTLRSRKVAEKRLVYSKTRVATYKPALKAKMTIYQAKQLVCVDRAMFQESSGHRLTVWAMVGHEAHYADDNIPRGRLLWSVFQPTR